MDILKASQEVDKLLNEYQKSPSPALLAIINEARQKLEDLITEEVLKNGIIR